MLKKIFACILMSLMIFYVVPLASLAEGNHEPQITSEGLQKFVDDSFKKGMEKHHVPGAIVSIVKDGKVQLVDGYGYADLEQKKPVVGETTVFRVGSISKAFAATATMQLVDQGKLDLHQDIQSYISSYQIEKSYQQPITLHHLLTHTAGLDEWLHALQTTDEKQLGTSGEYLAHSFPKRIYPPGVQAQYSNHGLGMVGGVIEERTGKSFEEYMQQSILQPLQMKQSSFQFKENVVPNLAKSYQYTGVQFNPIQYGHPYVPAAGSLNTTAPNMANFMLAHLQKGKFQGQQIISEKSAALMHQTQFTKHPQLPGIAYGLFEVNKNGLRAITHGGGIDGFQSMMYLVPEKELGIFISTNGGSGHLLINEFIDQFFDHYYPATQMPPQKQTGTSVQQLKLFEGTYLANRYPHHGYGKWLKFLVDQLYRHVKVESDGKLTVSSGDGSEVKQFYEIEQGLFQEVNGSERIYLIQKDGKAQLFVSTDPSVTFDRLEWYEKGIFTSSFFLVAFGIFLIASLWFVIGWMIRKWRKTERQPLLSLFRFVAWVMSVIHVVFSVTTLYFISGLQIVNGFPAWYNQVICSLPFISFFLAIWLVILLWKMHQAKIGKWWVKVTYFIFVFLGIITPLCLYYWNFLSIHFS
ncbi:serine hydrolase domain-containing protein [Hazenella coriacea]|uniref:CubicO group peptidase (Beta-lactamase class C family) n=1 Tax=Hazenella coriacea TaxID=1179467 RepID=A0A4R3L169_9BACL|nr:serine hydrolase domain-containing protein [Hazenella coriacea]TCS93089.1 CubicO group peptidase (beta-lactamase class C family) [Hazenella coriacea]